MLLLTPEDLEEMQDNLSDLGLFIHLLLSTRKHKYTYFVKHSSNKISAILRRYSPHIDSLIFAIQDFIDCIINKYKEVVDSTQALSLFDNIQSDLHNMFEFISKNEFTGSSANQLLIPITSSIDQIIISQGCVEDIEYGDFEFF